MFFQAQGYMDFQAKDSNKRTPSDEDVSERFNAQPRRAAEELDRIVQKHSRAVMLSDITALPATEAYRLISLYGPDFATTVARLIQDGCTITQSLMIATRQAEGGMMAIRRLAAQQRFSLSKLEAAIQPKACWRCRHYYGRVDGAHRLICAMHPYGPETDDCEDWESIVHHL